MSTAGIVAEYNPFHSGHARHIARTRENGADAVVCVMSSWFVQRGEPALMHPNARARMALMNGADLVISLPVPWACSTAQIFARGAVGLLDASGCIDTLSFGSECADLEKLTAASKAVDDYTVRESLRANLLSGLSFASARQRAVEDVDAETAEVLSSPNDILAVEYIRAIAQLRSGLVPTPVKREGAGHDSLDASLGIASASLIRERIRRGEAFDGLMPESCVSILNSEIQADRAPADVKKLETAILARLRSMTAQEIAAVPDISEGLENRIYSASRTAASLDELYSLIKTKRYSHARIRRAVMSVLLGLAEGDSDGIPPYIRVLGFNDIGREKLRAMRTFSKLPIVTRASDLKKLGERANHISQIEERASNLFALALPCPQPCGAEYTDEIAIVTDPV